MIPRKELELLQLKNRALDSVKEGITIADCSQPDMPIIYANEAFARLTGYATEYAVGRNCRFLQGYVCDIYVCDIYVIYIYICVCVCVCDIYMCDIIGLGVCGGCM